MRDDAWYPDYLDIHSGAIEIPHHQRETNTLHYFMAELGDLDPFIVGAYASFYLSREAGHRVEWVDTALVQDAITSQERS